MCMSFDFLNKENLEMVTTIATVIIAFTAVIGVFVTSRSLKASIDQYKKQLQLNHEQLKLNHKQLQLNNEQLQLTVFTDYTKRYQEIVLNFPENINEKDFDFDKLDKDKKEKTLRYMRSYFDLCSEECFLYSQGKIGENTWKEWRSGIKYAFSKTAFKKGWVIVKPDTGYYPDFISFVDDILNNEKT